ncbi:helix-turn-helix transcriptional regulator [Sporosarcina sp. CAU 1771]
MKIHLVAKDALEAEGIRWIVETHLSDVEIISWDTFTEYAQIFREETSHLLLIDMDNWTKEHDDFFSIHSSENNNWIGISSERIFRTAYRGLRLRADDVLFRPFTSTEIIKHIQQLRFQVRNSSQNYSVKGKENSIRFSSEHSDLFLMEKSHKIPTTMTAFLPSNSDDLAKVYEQLRYFPFPEEVQLFALSEFILCVYETKEVDIFQEEFQVFLSRWKDSGGGPLTIVSHVSASLESLKENYLQTKRLTEVLFFEGYDIILSKNEKVIWAEMDPFLTPMEQRQWIEMLDKKDAIGIRYWIEHSFLMYTYPYPDPELVRVKLTSVLAQIRRYMKSYNIQTDEWETAYHAVFQKILRSSVVYEIVQELIGFTTKLLLQGDGQSRISGVDRSLVEKVRELIESNYWNVEWGLNECADSLRIHKSTLSRRFSSDSGLSFNVVLHQIRLEKAKELLIETDLSFEKIANLTGYSYQSYFNTIFKKHEGCTPSIYRSRNL